MDQLDQWFLQAVNQNQRDLRLFNAQKIFLNLVNVAMFSYASSLVSIYSLSITSDIVVSIHSLVKWKIKFFSEKQELPSL